MIEQGNHSASYEGGATRFTDHLVVRHFPYRSPEQFVRKAKNGAEAYRATDLPEDMGAHWRQWGDLIDARGEQAFIEEVWMPWYWEANPGANPALIFDPCP